MVNGAVFKTEECQLSIIFDSIFIAFTVFFCWRNLRERDHLGDPDVDGRIILRWIFRRWDEGGRNGSSWLRIGRGGRHL